MASKDKRSPEYYREYRRKNRERYNARQRERLHNLTLEQKERRRAYKREWYLSHATSPSAGKGRGHGRHFHFQDTLSPSELKAHRYARQKEWRDSHREYCRELARKYYTEHHKPRPRRKPMDEAERKARKSRRTWLYRNSHYQECLEKERERHRKSRDKARTRPYHKVLSRRIPLFVENAAQARHLMEVADQRRLSDMVSFETALQSGLTVGLFSEERRRGECDARYY